MSGIEAQAATADAEAIAHVPGDAAIRLPRLQALLDILDDERDAAGIAGTRERAQALAQAELAERETDAD